MLGGLRMMDSSFWGQPAREKKNGPPQKAAPTKTRQHAAAEKRRQAQHSKLVAFDRSGEEAAKRLGTRWGKRHAPELLATFGEFERSLNLTIFGAAYGYDPSAGFFAVVFVHHPDGLADGKFRFEQHDAAVAADANRTRPVSKFLS
jgi:hypothetical protein